MQTNRKLLPTEVFVDDGVPHLKPFEITRHNENWKKIEDCVRSYEKVGFRNTYLFDWLLYMFENLHFSSVDKRYYGILAQCKTMISTYDVMIDDIADRKEERDNKMMQALLNIPFGALSEDLNGLTAKQIEYYNETKKVWKRFQDSVKKLPRYIELKPFLDFDIQQLLNSMRYSLLANQHPNMANSIENREYGSHSMLIIVQGTLDIMCSPKFNIKELGQTRKALIVAQRMGRIGQMISTWAKEVVEKDITNDLFVDSFENKLMKIDDLKKLSDLELLKKLNKSIGSYETEYNYLNEKLRDCLKDIKSFDTTEYLLERKFIHEKYRKRCHYWLAMFENSLHTRPKK